MTLAKRWNGFVGVVLVGTLFAAGCATNPATGKKQLSFYSEAQEIAMGQENDPIIVQQMGLYPDDELQAYVQRLGSELAAKSERPNLPWTFRVLDDPLVNAFALPGGFIYVTRGIMAYMNSEAELVSVLGHEIGHVTGRHTVNRLSKAQVANIGLGVGMILSPEIAQFGNELGQGLGLLFLKYSRDDEREADDLGLRYTVNGNYDAREMPNVFRTLKAVSESAGAQAMPGWLSTHPEPGNRAARIEEQVAATGLSFEGTKIERDAFYDRIDGMVFGQDPRQGYFEEALFLHPQLAFKLRFPEGWKTINQRDVVAGISPQQDAIVELRLAEPGDLAAGVRKFISDNKLRGGRVESGRVHGLPAAWSEFETVPPEGSTNPTILAGQVLLVSYGGNTYRLLGYSKGEAYRGYRNTFRDSLGSFDKVTDRKVLDVQPARVGVARLRGELTLPEFGQRYGASVPVDTLALINQLAPSDRLSAGEQFKFVTGGVGD